MTKAFLNHKILTGRVEEKAKDANGILCYPLKDDCFLRSQDP